MIDTKDFDFSIDNSPLPTWKKIVPSDPGWLYIIRNDTLFKVGKTTNPKRRMKDARTWLPLGEIISIKPFWWISRFERTLLCGLANHWLDGEWHQFPDETWYDFLIEGFQMFSDHDRSKHSVDFGYWIGSSGMGEVIDEQNRRKVSLRKWQREA